MTASFYDQWRRRLAVAELLVRGRDAAVANAVSSQLCFVLLVLLVLLLCVCVTHARFPLQVAEVEKDFELLGATAIEDKLQPLAARTVAQLRHAGITTWMLTGDKVGTAINIAMACNMITPDMEMLRMTVSDLDAVPVGEDVSSSDDEAHSQASKRSSRGGGKARGRLPRRPGYPGTTVSGGSGSGSGSGGRDGSTGNTIPIGSSVTLKSSMLGSFNNSNAVVASAPGANLPASGQHVASASAGGTASAFVKPVGPSASTLRLQITDLDDMDASEISAEGPPTVSPRPGYRGRAAGQRSLSQPHLPGMPTTPRGHRAMPSAQTEGALPGADLSGSAKALARTRTGDSVCTAPCCLAFVLLCWGVVGVLFPHTYVCTAAAPQ